MSARIWHLLVIICIQISITTSHNLDRDALMALMHAWQNTPLNWHDGSNPCSDNWIGISCTNSRVTSIILSSTGLSGGLPGDIGQLTELQILNLSYNNLTGSLTTAIGNLKNLTTLVLVGCGFNGPIPNSIGNLKRLRYLSLNTNSFTGSIPPTIGNLKSLYWLDLSQNNLTGSLPVSNGTTPGLDMLINTKHFHFGDNQLDGDIPFRLFNSNMTLIHLLFENNRLTGPIPSTLGLVKSLEIVRLDRNSLSGDVPSNFNNLINVTELYLSNNQLTGPVPNLTGMNSLNYVDLSNNDFEQTKIPSWFTTLQSLTTLKMRNTNLVGELPAALFSLSHLQNVDLSYNQIDGSLNISSNPSPPLELVDLRSNLIADFKQRRDYSHYTIGLILKDNPICTESLVTDKFCFLPANNTTPYSTPWNNCVPPSCSPDLTSSPNCQCAYPFTGLFSFKAPSFSSLKNATIYNSLHDSLMTFFKGARLPVDSVSLKNPSRNFIDYLMVRLEVFPSGEKNFNRTGIIGVAFALSNQTFKPLKTGFNTYTFMAENYNNFLPGSSGPGGAKNKSSNTGIIIGSAAAGCVLVVILVLAGMFALRQRGRAERATQQSQPFGLDRVDCVLPNRKGYLQTTHSWEYIGFSETIERNLLVESDTIIGVFDSGIWPESESFRDDGLGPIPAKWKGVCEGGRNFKCNRKIIGARSYIAESMDFSPRDNTGHGSHVASIAAGKNVRDASYYGIAQGIAKGGVPSARLAIYKVCDPDCYSADILAAFDDAITDGVDFISISLNFNDTVDVSSDEIAIGALHAVARGILTINSVGNKGPSISTIINYAPWILTVAASGTDRKIVDKLLLGNYATLLGNGINAFPMSKGGLPIAYGEVSSACSVSDARDCSKQCLERSLVDQKVVLCDKVPKLKEINTTGALAFILPNMEVNVSKIEPYLVVRLSTNELNLVKTYIDSTTEPRVQILKSEAIHNPGAPFVALFSSRGPSTFIPDIVKPDVTAPGVEILAAFSPLGSPSDASFDKRSVNYSVLSGTSMACPHVTAAAAYVKSFHTNWSPSAIKSALMTTAREFDPALYPEAEFAYGSGHIDPLKAINPGLVYETPVEDYFKIWCNISRTPGSFTTKNASCPTQMTPKDINYPSMSVRLDTKDAFTVSFPRIVTNVGRANSTYVSRIEGDQSRLHFIVEPSTLQFTALNQKMKFVVTVRGKRMKPQKLKRVSLVWTDGVHRVRSPIVVHTIGITSAGERVRTLPSCCITLAILLVMVMVY